MKSKFISAAVVAVAALTSLGASAETFNSFVFDQMAAPSHKTRAEVKAEIASPVAASVNTVAYSASNASNASSGSSFYGALAQQNLNQPAVQNDSAQARSHADVVKTSQK